MYVIPIPCASVCACVLQAASPKKVIAGRIDLGDSLSSEPLFIPSKPEDDVLAGVGEEDDGYLVAFVTPRDDSKSSGTQCSPGEENFNGQKEVFVEAHDY